MSTEIIWQMGGLSMFFNIEKHGEDFYFIRAYNEPIKEGLPPQHFSTTLSLCGLIDLKKSLEKHILEIEKK